MAIIAIASSKGGAGKTTLARIIAATYAKRYRVGALDSDRNPGFFRWLTKHDSKAITAVRETDESKLIDAIADLHDANDIVVVDTAGADTQAGLLAMTAADVVLVPSQLSQDDLLETLKTIKRAEEAANQVKRTIPLRVILMRVKIQTKLTQMIHTVFADNKVPTLRIHIRDLVGFGEMSHTAELPIAGSEREREREDIDALIGEIDKVLEPILLEEKAERMTNSLTNLGDNHHAQA